MHAGWLAAILLNLDMTGDAAPSPTDSATRVICGLRARVREYDLRAEPRTYPLRAEVRTYNLSAEGCEC